MLDPAKMRYCQFESAANNFKQKSVKIKTYRKDEQKRNFRHIR